MHSADSKPHRQATAAEWLAQMSDPKAWQSLMHLMQTSVPGAPAMPTPAALPFADVQVPPERLTELQQAYTEQMSTLWQGLMASQAPVLSDKRFADPAWQANPLYAFNAAAYLLNAQFLTALAESVEADEKTRKKIRFTVQQTIDALSPKNFLATNPEAQQKLIETKGESLTHGMMQLLADLKKGHISHTDESAFEVGKNVATSEGAVVFQNDVMQLLQYQPLTAKVYQRPLLIVPPCINKFYILDLQPSNSLIRYAVEQGHTVFVISWVNANTELGHLDWNDYIEQGVVRAIELAQEISGQAQINTLGFCVGGTLLATALAVLAERGKPAAASLTLLTTMLDFSDVGAIDVYIDEAQIAQREQSIGKGGLMLGRDFSAAFSSLRPNDLVWNYVESNYLKGVDPVPFDLLYWNADSTNLPGPMFCYYLRQMYLDNRLREPAALSVSGDPVDLGKLNLPTFLYASREDHIVPWTTAYMSASLLNRQDPSQTRFVLGASGHIAGVINPPAKKKRSYWTNEQLVASADVWFEAATEHLGSWWEEWAGFVAGHAGKQKAAPRRYGNAHHKAIEPAPGSYVKVKLG
jgi:polyhydroxyalkanoate synthase